MMMAFARKPLGYERGLAATIFLLFACPCSHFTFFFALTMGKRGKRRRRSKNSKHKNTHNASESTVTITGNENSTVKPWKSDIFSAPPSDEILTNFQQRWRRSLTPTDIQLHVWPMWMYSNKNIVGIAPTNSGKTLSYALPLAENDGNSIVLVPTRELARQVERELISVVSIDKIIVCIYGGVDRDAQVQALTKAVESDKPWIVTATTGRLVDVLNNESLPSLRVNSIVLDEADRMASNAEMAKQVDDILQQFQVASSKSIRVCLFSATSPVNVQDKWNEWIGEESVCIKVNTATIGETPVVSSEQKETNALETTTSSATQSDVVASKTATKQLDYSKIPAHVNQILHVCAAHKKPRKLMTTLQKIRKDKGRRKGLCLVFFARIKTLQYVSKLLNQEGYKAAEFHSQMAQSMRERTLMNFKSGKMPTLLATDIAARGIHVNNIDYIINYDFPGTLDQVSFGCREVFPLFCMLTMNPSLGDLVRSQVRSSWTKPKLVGDSV